MSACATATQQDCVASQPRSTTQRRIVLVDDDPNILETWEAILSQSGYEVHSFPDPMLALEAISHGCDCVITDYHLPQMTGVELIRAAGSWSKAKFILMTANGSEAVTREALSVGACWVVRKPTSPPTVLQKLASLWA